MYHTDGQARFRCKRYIEPCVQGVATWEGGSEMVCVAFSYGHILQLKMVNGTF